MGQSFINEIAAHAQRVHREDKILASLIIAQAIHESNWGRSGLAVRGKNLFGVKGVYNGQSITMLTWEVIRGVDQFVQAAFRLYPSWYESIKDLAELYKNGVSWNRNLYRAVIGETDYKKAAHAVAAAGYATDPNYAAKVIRTIEAHDLTRFDGKGSAPAADKTAPGSGGSVTEYTVKPGDTLSEIAGDFGTTSAALAKLNNLKDPNKIFAGQVLKLQGSAPAKAPAAGSYTVKAGDSLSKIAVAHKTTVSELAKMNGIKNVDLIRVGQVLKVGAGSSQTAPAALYHTVKSNESLSVIAASRGISLAQIKKLNPSVKGPDFVIHPGQKIRYK